MSPCAARLLRPAHAPRDECQGGRGSGADHNARGRQGAHGLERRSGCLLRQRRWPGKPPPGSAMNLQPPRRGVHAGARECVLRPACAATTAHRPAAACGGTARQSERAPGRYHMVHWRCQLATDAGLIGRPSCALLSCCSLTATAQRSAAHLSVASVWPPHSVLITGHAGLALHGLVRLDLRSTPSCKPKGGQQHRQTRSNAAQALGKAHQRS